MSLRPFVPSLTSLGRGGAQHIGEGPTGRNLSPSSAIDKPCDLRGESLLLSECQFPRLQKGAVAGPALLASLTDPGEDQRTREIYGVLQTVKC